MRRIHARGRPGRYAGMLEMAGVTQEILEDRTAAAEPSDAAEPSEEATFHLTGHKPALGLRFPNSLELVHASGALLRARNVE